jgi:hypothetical protein
MFRMSKQPEACRLEQIGDHYNTMFEKAVAAGNLPRAFHAAARSANADWAIMRLGLIATHQPRIARQRRSI